MKKIILLLSFFICKISLAQTEHTNVDNIFYLSKDSMQAITDSIAKLTGQPYSFDHFDYYNNNKYMGEFFYELPANYQSKRNRELIILVHIDHVGENKALEIEGVPRFYIQEIQSNFLNLFPFWKKYVDSTADINEYSKALFLKKVIGISTKISYQPTLRFTTDGDGYSKITFQ